MLSSVIMLLATMGAEPATAAAPVSPWDIPVNTVEKSVIDQVNAQRARSGLPPLAIDRGLMRSARIHTAGMAQRNSLVHTSAPVAENIAMGQSNASEVVRDWMNSPGHRANILGGYTRVGAAAYQSPGGRIYWGIQFLR